MKESQRNRSNHLDDNSYGVSSVLLLVLLLTDLAEWCIAHDVVSRCQAEIPATSAVKEFNNRCYHFISDEKYWTNANKTCVQYGADLVRNSDPEVNDFLTSALNEITSWQNDGVWIGLHDRNEEHKWEWTTGKKGVHESVSWTNWAAGHPKSSFHSFLDCARMRRSGGEWLWVDTPCEHFGWHYRFICEYDAFNAADSFHVPDHVEQSLIYFAIFGGVAVVVCITGTACGLIIYRTFNAKQRRARLRDRLERSRDETVLQRATLNMYVKLEDVVVQNRTLDAVNNSESDVDTDSAIYEEVSPYTAANFQEVTYQNQTASTEYLQMNSRVGSYEIVAQDPEETEDPYLRSDSSTVTGLSPPLNSHHCEDEITEDRYEEIGFDRQTQASHEIQCPPAQTLEGVCGDVYYNVSNHQSVSSDGRHIYERMDNLKTS